ncbi:MAG: endonuclease/exonuclease/phosphatase family protein [Candidatus Thiodiazotropha endolucinida]|nr:endonuclease/exonuclease/phosphatase family protein [Candidatus Thiodiazotropha endolucinida]
MGISVDQWRAAIGLFGGLDIRGSRSAFYVKLSFSRFYQKFKWLYLYILSLLLSISKSLTETISNNHFCFIILMLMLQALDIEKNPGPANSNSANAELSILHLNIRSIRNKIDYIKDHFLDFDILCFTETHLDHQITNDTLLLSDTFNEPYRRDRTNHGGGLLVYINSQLNHSRRTDLEIYCPESIWVEIKVNNINYLLGLFYSPRTADVTFFENLNLNIEKAYDLTRNLIILGDLNEDLFNDNYQNLKELILLNSLQNTVTVATRQSALLDHIIIFDDMQFLDSGTIDKRPQSNVY